MHRTRITRTNGTLSIELPQELLDTLGLHEGDEVGLGPTERGIAVFALSQTDDVPEGIDLEFAERVDAFIDKYRDALKSLAQR